MDHSKANIVLIKMPGCVKSIGAIADTAKINKICSYVNGKVIAIGQRHDPSWNRGVFERLLSDKAYRVYPGSHLLRKSVPRARAVLCRKLGLYIY